MGMPNASTYVIRQGDCISSIAEQRGMLPETLWDGNPELKAKRQNPNVLLPGDELTIPEKRIKEYPAATDQCHQFVRKGVPTRFRVVLERYQQPLANRQYILTVEGRIYNGKTSDTGLLEIDLPARARTGLLKIPEEQLECELQFGWLDPLDEITGAQARLQNLGYYHDDLNGEMNDDLEEALEVFQSDFGLPVTGELDDATKQKVLAEHDETHEFPPVSAPPEEEAAAMDDEIPSDESDVPTDEEDAAVLEALEAGEDSQDQEETRWRLPALSPGE
jgi:hypothetical protein